MRRPWTLALALLLAAGPLAWAQTDQIQKQVQKKLDPQRKDEKAKVSELDELFAEALKKNPDIRVAEAKVREVQEAANQVRMKVLGRIATLQHEIMSARAAADEAGARMMRERELVRKNASSVTDLAAATAAAQKFQSDVARLEAERDFIVGRGAEKFRGHVNALTFSPDGRVITGADGAVVRVWDAATGREVTGANHLLRAINERVANVQASTADKLRKFLDTPFGGSFVDTPAKDLLGMIQEKHPGVNIHLGGGVTQDANVTIRLTEPVPLGAVFQLLEDRLGWKFVIREYGIVASDPVRVPPGALYVQDFWKKSREKAPSD